MSNYQRAFIAISKNVVLVHVLICAHAQQFSSIQSAACVITIDKNVNMHSTYFCLSIFSLFLLVCIYSLTHFYHLSHSLPLSLSLSPAPSHMQIQNKKNVRRSVIHLSTSTHTALDRRQTRWTKFLIPFRPRFVSIKISF